MGDVRDLRSARSARRTDATAERDELVLPAERSAPRAARHWIMRAVATAGVHGAPNQVIELLAGEVVANAVLHGPEHGEIRVAVRIDGSTVRVEVSDGSPRRPEVQHPEPTAISGRGMALVEALSESWGVLELGPRGKTVWFAVRTDED